VANLYLFVFLVAFACLRGSTLHLTAAPVDVTSAPQSAKEWTYGEDGLLGDVFDNFVRLHELSTWQRFLMEQRFLERQYWRYAMYLKLGPRAFLRCLLAIARERKATLATRVSIFATAPFYMVKNALALLFSGQIGRTLFRRVEI
jgi:abequosyltransferase